MGTSTSSKGGKAGSPFDPEWLAGHTEGAGLGAPGATIEDGQGSSDDASDNSSDADVPASIDEGDSTEGGAVAPDRRYAEARTKMSAYLSGGARESLRSAAKSMVNKGMGGPTRAASTMRRTAEGVGQLGQFLADIRDRTDPKVVNWVERVRQESLSANDLILELIKEVLPDTGSVDDESLRNAAAEALGTLYEIDPNLDIFALTDQQIESLMGIAVANEVCNRMDLLLGQTYERLKFAAPEIQLYRKDIKEYVKAKVGVVMEKLAPRNLNPQQLATEVLASALRIFAE